MWVSSSSRRKEYIQLSNFSLSIEYVLAGRSLLKKEIIHCLHKHNLSIDGNELIKKLRQWKSEGFVTVQQAVTIGKWSTDWQCNRCGAGADHVFFTECARCGSKRCASCRYCLWMGRVRSCDNLYQFGYKPFAVYLNSSQMMKEQIKLTPAQLQVSERIKYFVRNQTKQVLFWAVTGAGKTESLVPLLNEQIAQGKRVLWCTPRKDVVLEINSRFRKLFCKDWFIALYGGSTEVWGIEPLVIATAHQTIRYINFFDVVIVDEADAFPLYGSKSLEQCVYRTLRESGTLIMLSATPAKEWKRACRVGKVELVTLPIRYHGHPLPVPTWKRERNLWEKVNQLQKIQTLQEMITHIIQTDGQAFLFVPKISSVEKMVRWLTYFFPDFVSSIKGVSSQDPLRDQQVMHFRSGSIRLLVTTTILERGVTVPRCHVIVIGADHSIFDRASLIQISGRVGRSLEYQAGKIWFLSNDKTEAICQAIREVQFLNRKAYQEFAKR